MVERAESPSISTGAAAVFELFRVMFSAALIGLAALSAPLTVASLWATATVQDADRFVALLAPLAHDEAVQEFLIDGATEALQDGIGVEQLVESAFSGLTSLPLPDIATNALGTLEPAAAEGVRSFLRSGAESVVTSPGFATTWERTLRLFHERALPVLAGSEDSALQLSDEGQLSLPLGPLVEQARDQLLESGFRPAALIGEVDIDVPLVQSDAFVQVRDAYQLLTGVAGWSPWLTSGALVIGLLLAFRRRVTLIRAALGAAAAFGITIVAFAILTASVDDRLAAATGTEASWAAVTSQLTGDLITLLWVGALISGLVAATAWFIGIVTADRNRSSTEAPPPTGTSRRPVRGVISR